jgi:hypothetical protein
MRLPFVWKDYCHRGARHLGLHHIFFWEILGTFGNIWEHLGKFRKFWEYLGTFEKVWEIWEQLLKILEKI